MPTALGMCRVVASSLARVSDAISTAVRSAIPNLALETSESELATAQTFTAIAPLVPRTGATLDAVFRHHLEAARMQFEQTDSGDVVGDGGIRVGVGFADLSGFTGLTQSMSMAELSMMLTGFEELGDEIVRNGGGRVVKYIGDAVMYVAPDAGSVAHIAERLLDTAEAHGLQARAGVTHGVALALAGDYFGPVVNLAARLVAMAAPGEILITPEVAAQLPDAAPDPLGPRPVRGFAEPVELLRLR
jgi:class 3 adenylate cyclase